MRSVTPTSTALTDTKATAFPISFLFHFSFFTDKILSQGKIHVYSSLSHSVPESRKPHRACFSWQTQSVVPMLSALYSAPTGCMT
jgi:hypothetical protein